MALFFCFVKDFALVIDSFINYVSLFQMMFDPPDYPYKDLSDTYDELLLSKNTTDVTTNIEDNILETSNPATFQSNDSGRYFNVNSPFLESGCKDENKVSYVDQQENVLNYEPTLLDEITVNQFLLPLQESSQSNNKVLIQNYLLDSNTIND